MEESLKALDQIIEWAKDHQNPVGYFAVLYKKVGKKLHKALEAGHFEHPNEMKHLDVHFFNRYLDALHEWHTGGTPSEPWEVALDAGSNPNLIVLQHLLMAMNAHIDFDLGIATAKTIGDEKLASFKSDFDKMNSLLFSLMDNVEYDLGLIWKFLRWINSHFHSVENIILDLAMFAVRTGAWSRAKSLAPLRGAELEAAITKLEDESGTLGRFIRSPGLLASLAVWTIRIGEKGTVADKISEMENAGKV